MKIVVIGNCQARPIGDILEKYFNEKISISTAIVHLLDNSEVEKYESEFQRADIIISQYINNDYKCEFVRTENIEKKYKNKLVKIINSYFTGYNPELKYLRINGKTISGPLGDYHIDEIYNGWIKNESKKNIEEKINDVFYNNKKYNSSIELSLNELIEREKKSNIKISDHIINNMYETKLFHTINHPNNNLLYEYCERIAEYVDIDFDKKKFDCKKQNEYLGQIYLPSNTYIAEKMKFKENSGNYGGFKVNYENNKIILDKKIEYKITELIDEYNKCYQVQLG